MTMPAAMTQEGEQPKRPIFHFLRIAFSAVCGIAPLTAPAKGVNLLVSPHLA